MRRRFTIDYDLNRPGQTYEELYKALRSLGAKRMMLSKWVLASTCGAATLRDHLLNYIDSNDRLFVAEVSGDWASWKVLATPDAAVDTQSSVGNLR